MSRGCIWTLVGIGVTFFLVIVTVIVVPLFVFDIVTSAPRVPVSTFITTDTAFAITIDPNQSGLPAMFAEGARQDADGIKFLMPHELGVVFDVDNSFSTRTATFILSPRHLGPALKMFLGNPRFFSTADGMNVDGIDTWDTESMVNEHGALILRGRGIVADDSRTYVQGNWTEFGNHVPVTLEGGHFAELVVANHDGRAVLILGNEALPAGSLEPTPAEALPSEAAEAPVEMENPVPAATDTDPIAIVRDIVSLRLTVDFAEPDLYTVGIQGRSPNPEAAARARKTLTALRESLAETYKQDGVMLEGEIVNQGERVSGDLRVTGVRPLVVRSIRANMQ
jgi:hypothetical protein